MHKETINNIDTETSLLSLELKSNNILNRTSVGLLLDHAPLDNNQDVSMDVQDLINFLLFLDARIDILKQYLDYLLNDHNKSFSKLDAISSKVQEFKEESFKLAVNANFPHQYVQLFKLNNKINLLNKYVEQIIFAINHYKEQKNKEFNIIAHKISKLYAKIYSSEYLDSQNLNLYKEWFKQAYDFKQTLKNYQIVFDKQSNYTELLSINYKNLDRIELACWMQIEEHSELGLMLEEHFIQPELLAELKYLHVQRDDLRIYAHAVEDLETSEQLSFYVIEDKK